ncbi:MAG: DUF6279 family lipoprotein [Proteobacteria bacterium]|nr:DUF6279 family lipoprotein [Pseudomonadota bacterium]
MNRGIVGFLLCSLLLQGCGVQLAYNNIDRLVRWQLSDYLDMSVEQREFYDQQMAVLLYWHRTTQLPEYADYLQKMSSDLNGTISEAEIRHLYDTMVIWGDRAEKMAKPLIVGLMMSMSDEQVAALPSGFKKTNNDLLEDEEGKSDEEARAAWVKGFSGVSKRLIGRLNDGQVAYVEAQSKRYLPERKMWVDYRLRWQDDFFALLDHRHDQELFEAGFDDLVRLRETYWSDEYKAVSDSNEALTLTTMAGLINLLTPRQRERMQDRLDDLQDDFRDLIDQAPKAPPPST